ncbi:rpsF, partial [Symbiodinium sp. CCMP2456]
SQGAIILLSSAGSFGAVADVKTPPEEVPLWEMPELLCSKLVLGSLPLADGEVVVVRSVRRWNSCMTEGPLLHLAEDRPPGTLLDIAVMDIQRHIDDRRFAIESLRHDSAKWSSCFRHLAKDIVAVSHPPLIGVDRHWSYAMQLLAAGHCQVSGGVTKPKLRYALSTEGYATAAASTELSPAQVKEAKHLEALTGRMVSWTPRHLIRLLALFPFARAGDAKFHAFWTQRLRDKTLGNGGRPQRSEVAAVRSRQAELWPPEPVREPSPEPTPKAKADDPQAPEPSGMQSQPSAIGQTEPAPAPSASKSDWKKDKKQWKEWKDWKGSERREKEPKKDKEDKRKRDASWERKAEKKASRKSPKRRSRSRSRSRRRRSRSRRKRNASREKRR